MFIQLALGTALLLVSIFVAGLSFWVMEVMTMRLHPWLTREPHRPKLMLVLCIAAIWVMVQMTIGVWIWAFALRGLGVFNAMEPAVYFSLVAFTTLGFGDILLPMEWRLLGGLAAANGLLNIGMVTALLVEALRQVRLQQLATRKHSE
ncbi:ion channel [Yoonia maritima]|uniref:Ion channel n=1 Tax=Yoonia maritima TaxID=1435347 RepID=A0A2T0VTX2_9RHOB|nr:ion channel [Yoonia maritima]PRY74786.1 ion channel [Yoonia maritima]